MKLTDLDRVIEALERAEVEADYDVAVDPEAIREALTLLRQMLENALEGFCGNASVWGGIHVEKDRDNPLAQDPCILILTPEN